MKTKHTPGPWAVRTDGIYDHLSITASIPGIGNPVIAEVSMENYRRAYQLKGLNVPRELKADQANAKLIAAAPEMLEALEECIEQLVKRRTELLEKGITDSTLTRAIAKGKLAIQKATE